MNKTALILSVFADGFLGFESAKELCCYAGLTPIIIESGSSINGRSRMSKMGHTKLRNVLFMCNFNACKCHKVCKVLYNRIVAKGKHKKLALIAVCNKLLKQAFAIVKNGLPYDEQYKSTLVNNEMNLSFFYLSSLLYCHIFISKGRLLLRLSLHCFG